MNRQIYIQKKAGTPKNLHLVEETIPNIKENEVLIKTKSIGMNFADVFAIYNLYSATPKGSFTPGLEYSGIVVSVGNLVKNFKMGDRVMGVTRFGAYSSHIITDEDSIFSIPNDWSMDEGAGFLVTTLTAYYALRVLGHLDKDKTILIHSAAGGVGRVAIEICKKYGGIPFGVVGDSSKIKSLTELSCDHCYVRKNSWVDEVKNDLSKLNREGIDLVLECIGGEVFIQSYNLLSREGRLITYGNAQFTPKSDFHWFKTIWMYITRPKLDPLAMIHLNRSVMGFNLIWMWDQKQKLKMMMSEIDKLSLNPPLIGNVYGWNDVQNAIHTFKTGSTYGKQIIRCDVE
jgi:alcohol dehydrogenase